jgi:UPF0755 protein
MENYQKIIVFFLVAIFMASALFYIWSGIYSPINPNSKENIVFTIKKGEGGKEIADNLKATGLIKMGIFFRIYNIFKGTSGKLQAGYYSLSSSMAVPEIVKKFISGDVVTENITIIEGSNLKDIAKYLGEIGFSEETFLRLTKNDFSEKFDFLKDKPKDLDLEGYLFPDTYQIAKDESLENIINKMLQNFDKKLTSDLRTEIKNQGKTIFEIITIASMIEKEVKILEDKKIVSGILWKRLGNKIPLQVDATISFITGKKAMNISAEETEIDSPYNTYKYRGLPLGPISNPGLESILASIFPESSEYWYYLSTPEGRTIFSKTLEEHNIAKEKYLKNSEQ